MVKEKSVITLLDNYNILFLFSIFHYYLINYYYLILLLSSKYRLQNFLIVKYILCLSGFYWIFKRILKNIIILIRKIIYLIFIIKKILKS